MQEEVATRKSTDSHDWLLTSLVNIANRTSTTIGITLHVGGALISGTLIGGTEYFTKFADMFSGGFEDPELSSDVREEYRRFASAYQDADDNRQPSYIHLIDARFYDSSGNGIPTEGTLWRGRLEAVDGFSLGRFSNGS